MQSLNPPGGVTPGLSPGSKNHCARRCLQRAFISLFCFVGLSSTALAQESGFDWDSLFEPEPAHFDSKWYLGASAKLDSWGIGAQPQEHHDQMLGLRAFHRMQKTWATGASLYFATTDNSFEFNLDGSLILPLRVFQPYLGAELSYLTRSNGGFALALKPGALIELQELPIQLNFFGLARYDIFNAVFGNQALNQLLLGAGFDVLFRI